MEIHDREIIGVEAELIAKLATKDDLKKMRKKLLERPYLKRFIAIGSGETDTNGNADFPIWNVPKNKTFFLYKAIIWADGYTPASAYSNAAAWLGIFHGPGQSPVNLADFAPYVSGSQIFPITFEWGTKEGPEFRGDDNPWLGVTKGPASTNVTALLFGELEDLTIRAQIVESMEE